MKSDLIIIVQIFLIIGSVYCALSLLFYYIRKKLQNHIKTIIDMNIYVQAKIISRYSPPPKYAQDQSYKISYSYPWEGNEYKKTISVSKKYFKSLENEEFLYVYLNPEKPEKAYLESNDVIRPGPLVCFILWIVFMSVGLCFLLTAFILYIIQRSVV